MDSKALLIPGNICAFHAEIGSSCLDSGAVCVEVIIYPFGIRMESGLIAICLVSHGESRVR